MGLFSFIGNIGSGLDDAVHSLGSGIDDAAHSFGSNVEDFARDVGSGVDNFVHGDFDDAGNYFSDAGHQFEDTGEDIFGKGGYYKALVNMFTSGNPFTGAGDLAYNAVHGNLNSKNLLGSAASMGVNYLNPFGAGPGDVGLKAGNAALGAGAGAAISGEQNPLLAAGLAGAGSYGGGKLNSMYQDSLYPSGGQSFAPYQDNSWLGQGQSVPSAGTGGMPMGGGMPDWMSGASGGQPIPGRPQQQPQQNPMQQLQQNPWFRGLSGAISGSNPQYGKLLNGMNGQTSPDYFDTIGRTLGSMYTQNKAKKDIDAQLNQYAANRGAYSNSMRNELGRKAAAGGRRSAIGPLEMELQARMAQLDSHNIPNINSLYNQRGALDAGMLNDVFTGVRRMGGPGQIYQDARGFFGQ